MAISATAKDSGAHNVVATPRFHQCYSICVDDVMIRKTLVGFVSFTVGLVFQLMCPFALDSSSAATTSGAVTGLQQCIEATHHLNVVALVDTSGSLSEGAHPSDPNNSRVTALLGLLNQLSSLEASSGVSVNASLVGFSGTASTEAHWMDVRSSLGQLDNVAASFATQNKGAWTDFQSGLQGAWNQILEAKKANPNACSAIVWFTDGQVQPPNVFTPGQTKVAVDSLCSGSAIPATIASNGVYTFAVGLGGQGGMSPGAANELKSYVQGGPNDQGVSNCGDGAITPKTGALFKVTDPQLLFFDFQSIFDPSISSNPATVDTCSIKTSCNQGVKFFINQETSGFKLVAAGPIGGQLKLRIINPTGISEVVSPANSGITLGGFTIKEASASPYTVQVTASEVAAPTLGRWRIEFLDSLGGPCRYSLSLLSPYVLRLTHGAPLTQAITDSGVVTLVDLRTGDPAQNVAVDGVTASVGDPSVIGGNLVTLNLLPTSTDSWSFSWNNTLPYSVLRLFFSGYIMLNNGAESVSVGDTQSVLAPLPPDYPTVVAEPLRSNSVREGSPMTLNYLVSPTNGVDGCVRLTNLSLVTPTHIPYLAKVPSPLRSSCVVISAPTQFSTSMTPKGSGDAVGRVVAEFSVIGRSNSQAIPESISSPVVVAHNPNLAKSISIFLMLLAVGFLILILMLFLLSRKFGRLSPGAFLVDYVTFDLVLADGGVIVDLDTYTDKVPRVPDLKTLSPSQIIQEKAYRSYQMVDGGVKIEVNTNGFVNTCRMLFGNPSASARPFAPTFLLAGDGNDLIGSSNSLSGVTLPSLLAIGIWIFEPTGIVGDKPIKSSFGRAGIIGVPPFLRGKITITFSASQNPQVFRDLLEKAVVHIDAHFQELLEIATSRQEASLTIE